jgi:hypothetical protein
LWLRDEVYSPPKRFPLLVPFTGAQVVQEGTPTVEKSPPNLLF